MPIRGGLELVKRSLRALICWLPVDLFALAGTPALANGHTVETIYSTDAVIRIVIAAIGGLLAVLGVLLAFKNAGLVSNVSFSRAADNKFTARFNKISQGVVIALLGVAVLIAGLYLLPDKTSVVDTTGKTITREGGRTTVKQ